MAVAALGPEKVREVLWFRPGAPSLALDPAIDGSLLSDEIVDLYETFRGSIRFRPEDIAAEHRAEKSAYELLARALPDEFEMTSRGEAV